MMLSARPDSPASTAPAQRFRAVLNRHPVLSVMVCSAIAAGAFYWALRDPTAGTPDGDFFDEATGEFLVRSIADLPPLVGRQGAPTVVRAYFSGAIDGERRKLLYLQEYSAEAKADLEQHLKEHRTGRPSFRDWQTAVWVRRPEAGSPWISLATPEGRAIAPDIWR